MYFYSCLIAVIFCDFSGTQVGTEGSQMDPSVSKDYKDEWSFPVLIASICALFIATAVIAFIYAGTDILTSDKEATAGGGGDANSNRFPTPRHRLAQPTTKVEKTAAPGTVATSSGETTALTTTRVGSATGPHTMATATTLAPTSQSIASTLSVETTTPKPTIPRHFTTVCTVSYLHSGLVVPPGDDCSYVFYDSLYLRPEDTFMGTFTNVYLKPLFDAANRSTNTRFGFSVHAPAVEGFTNEIRSNPGKNHYKQHWQHSIYSWGFLNIHELIVKGNPEVVKSALTVLKEMHDIAATEGRNASMAVGFFCRAQSTCVTVAEYMKNTFLPETVVILGHLSFRDNNLTDCFILGPSLEIIAGREYENITYGHTMGDAMKAVRYLQKTEDIDTAYTVSFTMAGRWYQPKNADNNNTYAGDYRPGKRCKMGNYSQKAHLQEVCDNATLNYNKSLFYSNHHRSVFGFDKAHGYTVTFENSDSFKAKLCNTWEDYPDLEVGIAVYDANYNATAKHCKSWHSGNPWALLELFTRAGALLNAGNFTRSCRSLN